MVVSLRNIGDQALLFDEDLSDARYCRLFSRPRAVAECTHVSPQQAKELAKEARLGSGYVGSSRQIFIPMAWIVLLLGFLAALATFALRALSQLGDRVSASGPR
jgi:hypothetical protein